jgi:hypothetical protein
MLLDIDHVLNIVRYNKHPVWSRDETRQDSWNLHSICWSKKVIHQLTDWHTSGKVDLRWLTSWGTAANEHFAPMTNLPQLGIGFDENELIRGRPEKEICFIKFYESQMEKTKKNKIIWVDDEVIHYLDAVETTMNKEQCNIRWVSNTNEKAKRQERIEVFKNDPNLLLIQPEPLVGLVPKHLDMINAFLEDKLPSEEMFAYHKSLPNKDNSY